jgi:hypothetical protein
VALAAEEGEAGAAEEQDDANMKCTVQENGQLVLLNQMRRMSGGHQGLDVDGLDTPKAIIRGTYI